MRKNSPIHCAGLPLLVFFLLSLCLSETRAQTGPSPAKDIQLWRFDELTAPGSCRAKGRFQDKEYCDSQVVNQILALGKDAIPFLISELTDDLPARTGQREYLRGNFRRAFDLLEDGKRGCGRLVRVGRERATQ